MPDTPDELPPYRAVLVVDAEGFGGNNDRDQALLADTIDDVTATACERAELDHLWREPLFTYSTGDGCCLGFDPRHLPAVLTRLLDALQGALAERDARLRARGRQLRLRMRAALHVGPVPDPAAGDGAKGRGATVIATHRLLDSDPLREALLHSDPEQTFLAAALSARVFEDVVLGGYTPMPESRFVRRPLEVKEFRGDLYLYVPTPSGALLSGGHGAAEERTPPARKRLDRPRAGAVYNTMSGTTHGSAIQVGHLHGDVRDVRG